MFKNQDHAKSATKSLFDFAKANPKSKLSEFRAFLASTVSYNSFFDLLNNIKTSTEAEKASLLELFQRDYAVSVNNLSFGRVFVLPNELIINYDIEPDNNGEFTQQVTLSFPLSSLKKAKIYGSEIHLTDDCDEVYKLTMYLPMNSQQVNITTQCDLITVRKNLNSDIEDEQSFCNNSEGQRMAKEYFADLLESIPNADGYSQDDIDALWEAKGCGNIEVCYDLDSEDKDDDDSDTIQIAFDIDFAEVTQTIKIIDNDYDEETIIEGLERGTLCTTTWHGGLTPEISEVGTDKVIGYIESQEITGDYINYR